nr:retrovirus-related Pol polyprotein from transposon TNT 1-94 [Tanacetum cinerariifolium]
MMRQNKNLLDINIDAIYNILKQNQGDVNDAMKSKKKAVVITFDPLALVAEQTKVSKRKKKVVVSSKSEGSDDELKNIIALLAKAFNRKKFYSKLTNNNLRTSSATSSANKKQDDSNQEINVNMVFMAQIEKVLSDSEASSSSSDDKIAENDNLLAQTKALQEQLKVKLVVIDNHVECQAKYAKLEAEIYEYVIRYSTYFDNDKQHTKQIVDQEILFDEMSCQLVEFDENVRMLKNTVLEKDLKISELEECVRNKDLEIKKCLERLNECKHKLHKIGQTNHTIHVIMPSKDKMYNCQKGIGFENPSYFCKAKDLRPTLYDERVIGLGLLDKEKENLKIIKSLKSKGFESSENVISKLENQSKKDFYVIEKGCDQVENSNVIAPGMLKLSVSQSVSPIYVIKTSCALNSVETKLKRKSRKRTSSKHHDKQVNKDVLRANKAFVHFSNLDTLSSVRIPNPSGVMWMKKGSSNNVKAYLSSVNHSNLNKNVKRYSCKNLMTCNNSDTRSVFDCKNARNALCNARMNASVDVNDLFVFDDVSIRKSHVSKMPFRKKPSASLNVPSRSKLNKSLPRTQTSSLKPYVPNVILEKIIIDLEDEVVNLLEKEKVNLETIESLKSKECDKKENPKVTAPRMFKLNVSQCVSPISMSKSSCDYENVEIKLKRKRRKRKSSKQNVKQVDSDVSRANSDFVHFSDLDIFGSVRRPKNSGVIWKKKGSSNTSNVGLSAVSVLNLNKYVKRYSRKDLLACNNSHLGETRSVFVCNDAMNVSCDSRMNDLLDDNNFFIFDDVNVRISPVSKMSFRKKPRDSMQVRSKSNMIKSLPRTVHKWLPKLQPLAEPVAKWFPRVIVQICLWIIDLGCSKHMMGNRALLTNFGEKFLRTVRFGNNDFVVIAGYRDVINGSMMIKKVYYVEGLGHNLFSIRQFCDKGLEVAFRKSTCFVRNEDGVDLLTGDRLSNLYTISLNEVA